MDVLFSYWIIYIYAFANNEEEDSEDSNDEGMKRERLNSIFSFPSYSISIDKKLNFILLNFINYTVFHNIIPIRFFFFFFFAMSDVFKPFPRI